MQLSPSHMGTSGLTLNCCVVRTDSVANGGGEGAIGTPMGIGDLRGAPNRNAKNAFIFRHALSRPHNRLFLRSPFTVRSSLSSLQESKIEYQRSEGFQLRTARSGSFAWDSGGEESGAGEARAEHVEREGRIQGSSNFSVLTKKGESQAETSRQMLIDDSFDICFSSPLTRSKRTAEIIWASARTIY
ncbi:hypothetical protein LWI28_003676 [Acer negundo]|uniref:Uncharacterized protein n=1 Tax=Acer negundo TaxID=4023 RepID=A0AAD5JII4_ACENE|nr:hypothetical protein LWI28_003676 [Acer negundo]